MNQQTVSVEKGIFRSALLPVAAFFLAAAAISGALAVGYLFHPASISAILTDLKWGQIHEPGAQRTWLVIYIGVTAINCLGTLVLSSGIFLTLFGRYFVGTSLLYNSAKYAQLAVNLAGAVLLPYFIIRVVRYAIICCQSNDGLMPLVSMLLMEAMMGALAWFLFVELRKFLDCGMDAAASIGYTLSSGKLKPPAIPPFSVSGFLFLGMIDLGIALDRFFSFGYIQTQFEVIYQPPVTRDPVQIISGLSFSFAALGSLALYRYLRGYKSKSEKLLLRRFKDTVAK